jgi:putative redox protein
VENKFNDAVCSSDKYEKKIRYSNGDITVVWQPQLCKHATHCFKELPSVFKPLQRKWIDVNGAAADNIIVQVKRCPSGALSFFLNKENQFS